MKKVFFAIALLLFGLASQASNDPGLKVGDKAPDFRLKNVDGKWVSLADYKDAKGYVVIFTSNHCPYAVAWEDRIIDLHRRFAPEGFPVIAINANDPAVQPEDSEEAMKRRAEEKSFPFAYLFDAGQKVFPQYGATKTPHVFLLDKDKVVRYIGAIDDNFSDAAAVEKHFLADAINALKQGGSPDPAVTRAVGCSIKVKK